MFSMNMEVPVKAQNTSYEGILEMIHNLTHSMTNSYVQTTLVVVLIYYVSLKIEERKTVRIKGLAITSFVISILWVMGRNYSIDNSLDNMFLTPGQSLKTVIYVIGATYFLVQLGYVLFFIFESNWDIGKTGINRIAQKHPFLTPICIITILLVPHLIISYPGAMANDSWTQIQQFFGGLPFTSHHPPVHTWLMGMSIKVGMLFGDANFGLFIYLLIQVFLFVVVFAYLIYTLTKWEVPRYVILLTYLAIALSPFFIVFACTILKDSIYSYMTLLFTIELCYMLKMKADYWKNRMHVCLWFTSIIGTMLMRNNGKYIVYPMVFMITVYLTKTLIFDKRLSTYIKKLVMVFLPIILANSILNGMITIYDISDHSIVDALSLPVQQTARYVTEHGDEVTEEEKAVLSKVFDYAVLETGYNPRISDPIKNCFSRESTTQDIIDYFKVWFKQFFKHPMTYVDATLNQNYTMIYPFKEFDGMIFSWTRLNGEKEVYLEGFPIYDIDKFIPAKDLRNRLAYLSFSAPIAGVFSNYAVYNLLLVYLIVFAMNKKMWKVLYISIPNIFSNLIVFAAPLVDPRYAFPVFYSMPLLLGFYLCVHRQEKKVEEREKNE